jgi:hypothetical protein
MCELRSSFYDTVFVKWRTRIGQKAVSKSYSFIEKITFRNGSIFGKNNVPLYGITCNIISDDYFNGRR